MNNFSFQNKTIYILSPEPWGNMRFSKHHYALELAQLGNRVYFISPPDLKETGIKIKVSEDSEHLNIVTYKPVYRGKRFLPKSIYGFLIQWQIRLLEKKIGFLPDLIFCFDPFRFQNLKWFNASVRIFFMADLFATDEFPEEAATADFCLGLSESRLSILRRGPKPAYFINHGLSNYYVEKANAKLLSLTGSVTDYSGKLKVGYIGNLMMGALDRATMQNVIEQHPEIDFIFWGQYERQGQLVALDNAEVYGFIDYLKAQKNVYLRGPVSPAVLRDEIDQVDFFWVCWKIKADRMWDGSNPHKILEYLSTGKPLVSHYIDSYKGETLIDMLPDEKNEFYADKFSKVVERLKKGESINIQRKRIQLALNNSYQNQIRYINKLINGSVG